MSPSIRLSAEVIATIKREAKRYGMTESDYVLLATFRFKDYDPHASTHAAMILRARRFAADPKEAKRAL